MPENSRNSQSTANNCVRLFSQFTTASATAFRFLGAIFISVSSPFRSLAAIFNTISGRLQLLDQLNRIFASAILTLQSFLQLKYQAIDDHSQSLFAAHPTAMRVAVASSAAYFLAYGAMLRFPHHRLASLAHHVLVSSGCIVVASLAAATLPDAAMPFVYAVFGSLAAAGWLYFLYLKVVAEEDEAEFSPFLEGIFFMRRLPV